MAIADSEHTISAETRAYRTGSANPIIIWLEKTVDEVGCQH